MKTLLKPALAAGIALAAVASPVAVAPSFAQAANVGVVNAEAVLRSTDAFRSAEQQRPTTYKAQIDSYNARRTQLQTQLQPLVAKLQADAKAANPNQQALAQQQATIQQIQTAGQQELQQLIAPVMLSQAYVEEQVADKFPAALEAAAKKKKVTLILSPDSVLFADATLNLNQDVLTALNAAIPTAQLVPPEGWLPREMREQQAAAQAQQAAAAGAPAAAPATTAPVQGR